MKIKFLDKFAKQSFPRQVIENVLELAPKKPNLCIVKIPALPNLSPDSSVL
jgi:hypothetical protein